MKKSNLPSLITLALAGIFIASCSSDKGLTVEKRKYRSGYSVSWNNGKSKAEQKSDNAEQSVANTENLTEMKSADAVVSTEAKNTEPALTASTQTAPVITKAEVVTETSASETVKSEKLNESKSESSTVAKKYTKADRKEMRKFLQHKAPGDTDIPLWAYILFAIILPPLAVGLYEGIHGPFWLSILLTLLFWLPGVIYAIWRVTRK